MGVDTLNDKCAIMYNKMSMTRRAGNAHWWLLLKSNTGPVGTSCAFPREEEFYSSTPFKNRELGIASIGRSKVLLTPTGVFGRPDGASLVSNGADAEKLAWRS